MLQLLQKVDKVVHQNCVLAFSLILLFLLRLPNFFEPYWYGDEGIYLTLGLAMRQGERLYLEIIDHKTPLIYYLAMVPNQFWFRVLLFAAMAVATTLFYFLAQKIIKNRFGTQVATIIFILFTTLPAFEGNIPNGELFVMFFILIGSAFFTQSEVFHNFFQGSPYKAPTATWQQLIGPFLAGIFFSLAILTKVPAVFDVFAFFSIAWFTLLSFLPQLRNNQQIFFKSFWPLFMQVLVTGVGVLLPIIISVVYYILRGSGKAYLDYGLLYNFRYADSWHLGFQSKVLLFLFTLPGKALVLGTWLLTLSLLSRKTSRSFQFIASWLGFALFAALLSNRPYPHYYLQVFPPLSLLIGYVVVLLSNFKHLFSQTQPKIEITVSAVGMTLLIFSFLLVGVGMYPTISYYTRFLQLATHAISAEQYRNSFDQYVADNERAANIIDGSPDKKMFIWGTDPMLYAQAGKAPVGRFTVAFHIKDFKAEAETINNLNKYPPTFIVVMKNESDLPGLNSLLQQKYIPNMTFEHFVLWKRF